MDIIETRYEKIRAIIKHIEKNRKKDYKPTLLISTSLLCIHPLKNQNQAELVDVVQKILMEEGIITIPTIGRIIKFEDIEDEIAKAITETKHNITQQANAKLFTEKDGKIHGTLKKITEAARPE